MSAKCGRHSSTSALSVSGSAAVPTRVRLSRIWHEPQLQVELQVQCLNTSIACGSRGRRKTSSAEAYTKIDIDDPFSSRIKRCADSPRRLIIISRQSATASWTSNLEEHILGCPDLERSELPHRPQLVVAPANLDTRKRPTAQLGNIVTRPLRSAQQNRTANPAHPSQSSPTHNPQRSLVMSQKNGNAERQYREGPRGGRRRTNQ
jgi:hypothetical protein